MKGIYPHKRVYATQGRIGYQTSDQPEGLINIVWEVENNHQVTLSMKMRMNPGPFIPVTLDQLMQNNLLSESNMVDLMGRVITQYRDDHIDLDSNFHAAALHQMVTGEKGKEQEYLVISNNIDPVDSFNRACAEMRAIQEAKGALKIRRDEMRVGKSFLMGQSIIESKDGTKKPVEYERVTPCGHCRDELTAISDKDSELYVYPAMTHEEYVHRAGTMKLRGYDHAADITEGKLGQNPHEVVRVPITSLLPQPVIQLKDAKIVGKMKEGVEFVEKDNEDFHLVHVGEDKGEKITAKELSNTFDGGYTLENINKALVNKIKDRFHREGCKHGFVTAAMVRRGDGKCYIASGVQKDERHPERRVPSQPDSAVEALSKSGAGNDVKEMVVMRMDKSEIEALSTDQPPTIKTLKGSALDRLAKKSSLPEDGKTFKDMFGDDIKGRAKIHILPFNDGNIAPQMLRENMKSFGISELYPLSFENPSSQCVQH